MLSVGRFTYAHRTGNKRRGAPRPFEELCVKLNVGPAVRGSAPERTHAVQQLQSGRLQQRLLLWKTEAKSWKLKLPGHYFRIEAGDLSDKRLGNVAKFPSYGLSQVFKAVFPPQQQMLNHIPKVTRKNMQTSK